MKLTNTTENAMNSHHRGFPEALPGSLLTGTTDTGAEGADCGGGFRPLPLLPQGAECYIPDELFKHTN